MTEQINSDYEVSSEGAVRHWEIPYARLEDATPTATNPAAVIDDAAAPGTGLQLTGTILTVDATDSIAIIDFTASMVYLQAVRTVNTYAGEAESAWGIIYVGSPVYYDRSATMPAGVYLSLAAADNLAVANPLFGFVVPANETDTFGKAAGVAGNTWDCAVMQVGAGN